MSKKLLTVDIAEGIGGPSATAVFKEQQLPQDRIGQVAVLRKAYKKLQALGHELSKLAVVSPLEASNEISFRSIQVRGVDEKGDAVLETGGNCGNSMVASTLVALRKKFDITLPKGMIVRIRNIDTNFAADMEVTDDLEKFSIIFDMHIPHLVGQIPRNVLLEHTAPTWFASVEGEQIPITTLNIANPYIIVSSTRIGIRDAETLLKVENCHPDILGKVKNIRGVVIRTLALPSDSEFPKIAVVHGDGTTISARTLYLQKWHPGLPITGAISLAVATQIKDSVLDLEGQPLPTDEITIRTPREQEKICIETSKPSGALTKCVIRNRKAVIQQRGIEICF